MLLLECPQTDRRFSVPSALLGCCWWGPGTGEETDDEEEAFLMEEAERQSDNNPEMRYAPSPPGASTRE